MSTVPNTKMTTTLHDGEPFAAIHSAVSVGHNNSSVPIGLSRRINRSYASSRPTIFCQRDRGAVAASETFIGVVLSHSMGKGEGFASESPTRLPASPHPQGRGKCAES